MLATDANIASVGWCWQACMRVLVDECLDSFFGEALLGFVCWRLMLISPTWAGVDKLGFVCVSVKNLISLQSGLSNHANKLRVAACALPRTPRLAQLASTTPPIDRPRAARRIFFQFFFPAPRTRVIGRPKSPITKSAAAARKPRRGSRQCTGGSGFPSGWRW